MRQRANKARSIGVLCGVVVVVSLIMAMAVHGRQQAVPAWSGIALARSKTESEVQQPPLAGKKLIPMGRAVGIKLFSDGVLVVGISPVQTQEGARYPGRECGLKAGDVITHIDGDEVDTIEQVQQIISQNPNENMSIQAMRGQKQLQLTARSVENSDGDFQLGVWLRDSMAGIGTITFYDPDSGVFAALGHGINDVDTAMLMPLESGSIMGASVADVQKGAVGEPGELHGSFDLTTDIGTLYANTNQGVFGRMPETDLVSGLQPIEVATAQQVKEGPATILSNVRGDEVEEFAVKITHISSTQDGTRSLMVQVTDEALLETTGGIVQGMSGSPILQDGRLVGAVTHVLVNDPTRGYGILAQEMCKVGYSQSASEK